MRAWIAYKKDFRGWIYWLASLAEVDSPGQAFAGGAGLKGFSNHVRHRFGHCLDKVCHLRVN